MFPKRVKIITFKSGSRSLNSFTIVYMKLTCFSISLKVRVGKWKSNGRTDVIPLFRAVGDLLHDQLFMNPMLTLDFPSADCVYECAAQHDRSYDLGCRVVYPQKLRRGVVAFRKCSIQ